MLDKARKSVNRREEEYKDWHTAYYTEEDNFYDAMMEEDYPRK